MNVRSMKNTRVAGLEMLKGREITIRSTRAINEFDLEAFQGSSPVSHDSQGIPFL
jgi:hypothetical protein